MAANESDSQTLDTTMTNEENVAQEEAVDVKPTYKSFKKKFRKMKLKFDEAMRQSNELYIEEQRAIEAAKRIAQENDRLLDFLLDVNNSAQLPVDKRIDLTSEIPTLSAIPPLINDDDLSKAAILQTTAGQTLYNEIRVILKEKTAESSSSKPTKSIGKLMAKTPHLAHGNPKLSPEFLESLEPAEGHTAPYSYLTLEQMDDYLWDIDALLGMVPPMPHAPHQEVVFGHHHSPYNWLRRHVPQIFLQDGEGSEKSNGKPGALRGAGKRASIPAPSKPDALEIVEEDGIGYDFSLGGPTASKNKRKREDDDGYHPKSGRGGDEVKVKKPRQARKKKSDGLADTPGTTSSGRKKKAKIPSPPPGAHPFGPL